MQPVISCVFSEVVIFYTMKGKGRKTLSVFGMFLGGRFKMDSNRIEGLWDCSYCGQKGIRARFDRCPGCSGARLADTMFYLPTDVQAATLTSEEAAQTSDAPDWLCKYCGSLNRSDETVCRGCSADRAEATDDYATLHTQTMNTSYEQTLAEQMRQAEQANSGVFGKLADLFRRK